MLGENTNIAAQLLDIPKNLQSYGNSILLMSESAKKNAVNYEALKIATTGLNEAQTARFAIQHKSILLTEASTDATEAERKVIIAKKLEDIGLEKAQAAQTAQEILSTKAKIANTSATTLQNQAKVTETLTTAGLSAAQAKNTAIEIANMQAKAVKAGTTKALVQTEIEELLITKGLTAEKATNTAATIAQTTANAGHLASIHAITAGLWAQAKAWLMTPMGMITAIGAGILAIAGSVYYLSKAYERQIEKVKELEDAYKSLQPEIDSVNNELKTTQDRMLELSSMDTLSFVEAEELTKLQAVNDELETRLALLNKEKDMAANKLADESITLFKKGYGKNLASQEKVDEYVAGANVSGNALILTSDEKDISAMIAAYQQFLELKNQATEPEDVEHFSGLLTGIEESLLNSNKELQTIYDNLSALPNPTNDQKEVLDEVSDALKLINALIIPDKIIGNIFAEDQFQGIQQELEKLASSGKLSADIIKTEYSELNDELNTLGIGTQGLIDFFNNLSAIKLDTITNSLIPVQSELKNADERIKEIMSEFSQGEINILINADDSDIDLLSGSIDDVRARYNIWQKELADKARMEVFEKTLSSTKGQVELLSKALREQEQFGEIVRNTYDEIAQVLSAAGVKSEDYESLIVKTADGYELASDKTRDFVNNLIQQVIATETANGTSDSLIDKLRELFELVPNTDSIEEYSKTLQTAIKNAHDLAEAQEIMYKAKTIDPESLKKIIAIYPEAIAYANDFAEMQKFVSDKILEQENIARQAYGDIVLANDTAINAILNKSSELPNSLAIYYGYDYNNFVKMSNGKYKVEAQTVASLSKLWEQYAGLGKRGVEKQMVDVSRALSAASIDEESQKALTTVFNELGVVKSIFDSIESDFQNFSNNITSNNNSGGSGSSKKEIDEYIAKIDALYEAEEKLKRIRDDKSYFEAQLELTGDLSERKSIMEQTVDLAKQEQNVLKDINKLRSEQIEQNIKTLSSAGFDIDFDEDSNRLLVKNLAHINKLTGSTAEETNELRKSYEKLIEEIISLNDANRSGSSSWWDLQKSINSVYNEIFDLDQIAKENNLKLLANQLNVLENNLNFGGVQRNLQKQIAIYREIMTSANAEIDRLREMGYSEYGSEISSLTDTWWEARNKIKEINSKIYDDGLNEFDRYIQQHSKLNSFGVESEISVLKRKQSYIEQSYKNGLISYKQYIDGLIDINESLYDAEISRQNAYRSGVLKILEAERKILEDLKQYYEKQKSNYETTVSTVTSLIDKRIKAIQDENQELDKQLKLQQSLEEIERAKSQRVRVFVEGKGFVYRENTDEVKKAQKSYDELKRQFDIEDQIAELEAYKQKWLDTVENYQRGIDAQITASILGANWEQDILNLRTSNIYAFEQKYNSFCNELNEDVVGSVSNQIKQLDSLTEQWRDSFDDITDDIGQYEGVLDELKEFESLNYTERLNNLSNFISTSKSKLAELQNAAIAASAAMSAMNSAMATSSSTNGYIGTGNSQSISSGVGGGYVPIKKYESGGVVDYTGLARVHGGSNYGAEIILNNNDASKLYTLIHNTPDLLGHMFKDVINSLSLKRIFDNEIFGLPFNQENILSKKSPPQINLEIGDINLFEVQDVNTLSTAIVNQLPNRILQDIHRLR